MDDVSADSTTAMLCQREFRFVRRFLWWVLASLVAMVTMAAAASWHFAMDVAVQAEGIIRPRTRCLVKPEVDGRVQAVLVAEGDRVSKGQPLMQLDDLDRRQELSSVELELKAQTSQRAALEFQIWGERQVRQADIDRVRYELAGAQVALERVLTEHTLEANLRDLLPDWSRLPVNQLVPVRQANATAQAVQARLELAESELAALRGRDEELRVLEERRGKLEIERERLLELIDRSVIRAPVAGVCLSRETHRLQGDRVLSGQAVLQLAGEDGWLAEVEVGELDRPRVEVSQPARVYASAFPHMEYRLFSGNVVHVAEQSTPDHRTYTVQIAIDDPLVVAGGRTVSVRDGMSVTVRIVVDRGRIASLARRRLVRHLGQRPLPNVHLVDKQGAS